LDEQEDKLEGGNIQLSATVLRQYNMTNGEGLPRSTTKYLTFQQSIS